jgi:hypothetical protein
MYCVCMKQNIGTRGRTGYLTLGILYDYFWELKHAFGINKFFGIYSLHLTIEIKKILEYLKN